LQIALPPLIVVDLLSCLRLFIDGTPHGFARQLDSLGLTPNAIAAVEVYERPSIVPFEFQGSGTTKARPRFLHHRRP